MDNLTLKHKHVPMRQKRNFPTTHRNLFLWTTFTTSSIHDNQTVENNWISMKLTAYKRTAMKNRRLYWQTWPENITCFS